MKKHAMIMLVFGIVLAVSVQVQAARFFGLGDLDGGIFSSSAYGVSADGLVVVGRSKSASGTESFRWVANDGMIGLGDLDGGSFFGGSTGASADGAVVVGFSKSSPGHDDNKGEEAFRWTEADGMVGLGTLGGDHLWSCAYGVNADGSIVVGWSGLEYGVEGREAFRWTTDGGMVGLGDLDGGEFYSWASDVSADGSVVVGASKSAFGEEAREAFRWTADDGMVGLGRLEGSSNAYAVSAVGLVVVGASGTDSRQEAFRWTEESGMVGLGDLAGGGFWSTAFGLSADGSVVVGHSESASGVEAFIWDETNGMRSLKDVLTNDYGLDLTSWTLMSARGISDDGRTVVGYGSHPDNLGNPEAWVAILPEPQTYYVDADATGNNNGSSWTDAFNYLQDALTAAQSGDEIWVAQGTYTPDSNTAHPDGTGDREATFRLKNGVAVRGGYAGYGEPDPNARDIDTYETILSGDLNGNDELNFVNNEENSYHVVTGSGTDETTVLDGFTITAGNANDLSNCPDCHTAGAGMFNENASPTIANCTFRENFVGNDADLSWCGAGMYNYQSSPTLTNCTFRGNSIVAPDGATGGGMHNEFSSPTLTECSFIDNSAGEIGDGGGMYNLYESSPTLINCIFSGNLGRKGGGMANGWNSTPILINCTFSGNLGTIRGGGISNWQTGQGPTLTDCIFRSNSADHGGGIYNGNNSSLTVTGCYFNENTAGSGGGMYNDQSSPTLTDCTFSNNMANGGGGMYSKDSSLILIDCSFSGNWTNLDGAGMYNKDSSLILTNCTFDDNRAEDGNGGGMDNSGGSLTVTGCTFINNYTFWAGGGVSNSGVNSTLTNCMFASNVYAYHGGGMSNSSGSTILTNCAFTGNFGENGGGMYNWSGSSATLRNCTFSQNSAYNGGGIGNFADYSLTMTNCIVWGNTPDEIDGGAGIPVVTYSDVQGGWEGVGNIDADPLFADANGPDGIVGTEDDNLRLLPVSPCINTGDPCYVAGPNETDLDGNPRVTGGRIDMGAYEANYIQARLWLFPQVINRHSRMKAIMAWVHLPENVTEDQIDADQPVLLYPGAIEPVRQNVFQHGKGDNKSVSIFAFYNKAELMAAVPDNGPVDLEVIGSLNTGQYFHGSDTIRIIGRR